MTSLHGLHKLQTGYDEVSLMCSDKSLYHRPSLAGTQRNRIWLDTLWCGQIVIYLDILYST